MLHLLSTVGVELFLMAGVDPSRLDGRISSHDFSLMMLCIGSLAASGVFLVAAYIDVLLLGGRFPRATFYIAAGAAAVVSVWVLAHFLTLENAPALKSYLVSHVGALGAGAISAILMLLLSKVWPRTPER